MARRTQGCPGKGLLFLFLLLGRFYNSCAFYERREHLKTLRNDLLEKIKYVKTQAVTLAEYSGEEKVESELEMNHVLSSLLEMGDSITDEEELEMFQTDLQAVVNEVEWQRLIDRQLFLVEAERIYANIEEGKKRLQKQISTLRLNPSLNVLHHNVMQILEDTKKYVVLRFWSITAEAEDIERILKIYHVSEFEHPIDNDLDFHVSEFENELQEDFDFYFPESDDELDEDLDFYVSESDEELHEEL